MCRRFYIESLKIYTFRAGEMAQRFRSLVILPDAPSLVRSICVDGLEPLETQHPLLASQDAIQM